ncbi:uncharacterized protein LOC141831754 [Curcuma longa]|uniref:uncharacterized protein LOC141831754 n=1 Tax=Curcuma longa TaxID=136217 RepID=UPI003D9E9CC4
MQPKEHFSNRKRSHDTVVAKGGTSHSLSNDEYSGANARYSYSGRVRTAKKLPVSAPGRAALSGSQNNIEMDLLSSSISGSVPMYAKSNGANSGTIMDERELRREKRKQSNRESARRSRMRKQVLFRLLKCVLCFLFIFFTLSVIHTVRVTKNSVACCISLLNLC